MMYDNADAAVVNKVLADAGLGAIWLWLYPANGYDPKAPENQNMVSRYSDAALGLGFRIDGVSYNTVSKTARIGITRL
jgi:hypothetical protein